VVWREVLSREVTRPTDNFFDFGGDSLLLTRLHDRLTDMTGVEIPMG
jgi:acyl carrier protein